MQNEIGRSPAYAGPAMLWAWQVVDTAGRVLMRGESRNYLDALARAMAAKSTVETPPPALPSPSVRAPRHERRAHRHRT